MPSIEYVHKSVLVYSIGFCLFVELLVNALLSLGGDRVCPNSGTVEGERDKDSNVPLRDGTSTLKLCRVREGD